MSEDQLHAVSIVFIPLVPGTASGTWLTNCLLIQLLTNGEEKEAHVVVFSGPPG